MAGSLSGPVVAIRNERPPRGGQWVSGPLSTLALSRGVPAPKKGGALTTSTRLVRRHGALGGAGTAGPVRNA